MNVAFPTQEDLGLESRVYGHFGSADFFILIQGDESKVKAIKNQDKVHSHGNCSPARALGSEQVDAVVAGGIGAGALGKLNAMGIQVYRAIEGTVKENYQLIRAGRLPLFTRQQTCAGHHHGSQGGCSH